MIYLDTSVALAHLLADTPPGSGHQEEKVSVALVRRSPWLGPLRFDRVRAG
jgi:hypothetical protein